MTDPASAPPVAARWLGAHRIELARCGSTNDEAARLARAGAAHGTVVIARAQDAGRGRDGRSWASPEDAGVYLSAIVRPALAAADVPPQTLAIGVGVCDAARAVGAPAALKWPNDVLARGKKLAGILVEAHSQGGRPPELIVGIGVNLTGRLLDPAVAGLAIALDDAAGAPVDRAGFVDRLLAEVERWIDRHVAGGVPAIAEAWRARMAPGLTGRAMVGGRIVTGALHGLAPDGALQLRDERGAIHDVRSGDVEVIRPAPDRADDAGVLHPAG